MPIDIRGVCPLLMVYDMPTSLRFYRDVLGFEIVGTSPQIAADYFHWVWLKLGQAEIMLNPLTNPMTNAPPSATPLEPPPTKTLAYTSAVPMSKPLTKNRSAKQRPCKNPNSLLTV